MVYKLIKYSSILWNKNTSLLGIFLFLLRVKGNWYLLSTLLRHTKTNALWAFSHNIASHVFGLVFFLRWKLLLGRMINATLVPCSTFRHIRFDMNLNNIFYWSFVQCVWKSELTVWFETEEWFLIPLINGMGIDANLDTNHCYVGSFFLQA